LVKLYNIGSLVTVLIKNIESFWFGEK